MELTNAALSYSALSNITGMVAMLTAWAVLNRRINKSISPIAHSVELMRNFFLMFGIFYIFISVPFYTLYVDPAQFGLAMAIGFSIGHAFLFVSLTYSLRLFFTLMPRLKDKERYAVYVGAVAVAWIFVAATVTMVFGENPVYDYGNRVVDYRQAPVVANSIAVGAMAAWLPLVLLFFRNAAKSSGWQRIRSLLLGLGFITLAIAGPLHGTAENYVQLIIADVLVIAGLIMLVTAILRKVKTGAQSADSNVSKPKDVETSAVVGHDLDR